MSKKPLAELAKEDFDFADFGQQLLRMRSDFLNGTGFAVLRGLPEDWRVDDSLEKRRYLVRLWLSTSDGRSLPSFMKEHWGNIEVGAVRGGITAPGVTPTVVLESN